MLWRLEWLQDIGVYCRYCKSPSRLCTTYRIADIALWPGNWKSAGWCYNVTIVLLLVTFSHFICRIDHYYLIQQVPSKHILLSKLERTMSFRDTYTLHCNLLCLAQYVLMSRINFTHDFIHLLSQKRTNYRNIIRDILLWSCLRIMERWLRAQKGWEISHRPLMMNRWST